MKRYFNLLLILYLSFAGDSILSAQDSIYSRMKTEARQLFESRNYESALPVFHDLLYRFPKEPEYQYGTAVCLTRLNRDPEEAISLLRSVSTSGYNPISYYYLGLLLHRGYLFDDAIKAYSRFILLGKPADIKSLKVERQIEMAKNGMEYIRKGIKLQVLDMKILTSDQMENASAINGSGKLVKKPVEFCSKVDLKEGYRPLMYLPVYTEMNDYVYFSGYEKHRKNLKQIYRVRNINHETWSLPEPLNEVINTTNDDEFPYFDAKASVIYFSSKGHSSLGGYDIFRSAYDWNTKTWSKPENMGFPINSPYDDYFYITDEFSQTASFVSNRNTGPGSVSLYKIKILKDTASMRLLTLDEIQNVSLLHVESGKPPVDFVKVEIPEKTGVSGVTEISLPPRNDYNKVLAEALNLQLRSDSLSRIARDKRLMARETIDDAIKKQQVTDIIRVEKEQKKWQRAADLKFSEAQKLKKDETATMPGDTMMVVTNETEGTRVFSYNTEALPSEKATGTTAYAGQEQVAKTEKVAPVHQDEFNLTEKSLYSPSNPIPKGLAIYSGLVYRIQLGAFSKPRPDDAFGGISPISCEQVNNTTILKYYAGLFYSLNSVSRAMEQIKKTGFPDAFIVAFLDGNMISTEKAKEVEFAGMKL